jgi:glycosyltransferase involved in cell wall biosynthesis
MSAAGPIARLAVLLGEGLQTHGWAVRHLAWGSGGEGERGLSRVSTRLGQLWALERAVATSKSEVVLVHTAHDWKAILRDIPLIEILRLQRRAVVVMFHGSLREDFGRRSSLVDLALRHIARRSDAILVLSRHERDQWHALDPGVSAHVVRNSFRRSGDHAHAHARQVHDPARLLFVGRLIPEKGVLDVIEALAIVRRERGCALTIAGAGPKELAARDAAARLGLNEAVRFAGFLSQSELRSLYSRSDILVLPTSWKEGFPTVLLEAMDAGLALVVSPVAGVPDQLEDRVNALFTPAHNPARLAELVQELICDKSLYAQMADANLRKISEYSPEDVAAAYGEVLSAVVNGRRRSKRHDMA